jgi:hypothetical protein
VDHPVAEPLAGGGAAVVRIVGVEGHDHPGRAGVRGPRQVKDCAPDSVTPKE